MELETNRIIAWKHCLVTFKKASCQFNNHEFFYGLILQLTCKHSWLFLTLLSNSWNIKNVFTIKKTNSQQHLFFKKKQLNNLGKFNSKFNSQETKSIFPFYPSMDMDVQKGSYCILACFHSIDWHTFFLNDFNNTASGLKIFFFDWNTFLQNRSSTYLDIATRLLKRK